MTDSKSCLQPLADYAHPLLPDVFLQNYFRNLALSFLNRTGKVLEVGYSVGLNLYYLRKISNLDFFGCDIKQEAMKSFKDLLDQNWRDSHVKVIDQWQPLPYSNKQFDVVYTVNFFNQVRPSEISIIISELVRITKGHILHIESPSTNLLNDTQNTNNNYVTQSLIDIYNQLGHKAYKLPDILSLQYIYIVDVDSRLGQSSVVDILSSVLLDLEKEYLELQKRIDNLEVDSKRTIEHFYNTRTAKFQRWLSRHPLTENFLVYCYDNLKHLKRLFTHDKSKIGLDNPSWLINININDPKDNLLVICHPNWQGVRSAAEGQSRNRLFLSELNENEIYRIIDIISSQSQRTIIFNGFWKGYDLLMISLKKHINNIHILYVHHGSFYQMNESKDLPMILNKIYRFHQNGIIDRVGFVKKGMPEAFHLFGKAAWYVMNYVEPAPNPIIKTLQHPIRVGIPVENSLRKNPHTQIIAALLIVEVDEIHLWHQPDFPYLKSMGIDLRKIIVHSNCNREKTRDLLNQMTFTMYVTISECFPMLILESFSAATPCFSSYTHGILDDMPELAKQLMIPFSDNPVSIAKHIQKYLPFISELSGQVLDAYYKISNDAQESIRQFSYFE